MTVIDGTVQFASHVVNVVVPNFGDTGLTDDGVVAAARKFYDHFRDTYDSLAFIPELAHVTEYDGAHVIVKNQVQGIGLRPVDDSSELGSAGTLQAIEVYPQASFTTNATSSSRNRSADPDCSRLMYSSPRPTRACTRWPSICSGPTGVQSPRSILSPVRVE